MGPFESYIKGKGKETVVKVMLDNYQYNASILGFIRVLDHAGLDNCYKISGQSLEFEESIIENFADYFINYLVDTYQSETNYQKIINYESIIKNLVMQGITTEEQLNQWNDIIKSIKGYLESPSYKSSYSYIEKNGYSYSGFAAQLKAVKKKKEEPFSAVEMQVTSMYSYFSEFFFNFKEPRVGQYLMARVLTYSIIAGFWNNVAFLNRQTSKRNIFEEYTKYFVQPAKQYLINKASDNHYDNRLFCCTNCEHRMKNQDEIYSLSWLQHTGVDNKRKTSHYHNHIVDTFLCPVCALIYSCLPFGFILKDGKGFFLNDNQSINNLISVNNVSLQDIDGEVTIQQLEQKTYFQIANIIIQNANERLQYQVNNIQVVKFNKDDERRPFQFNLLSRSEMNLIIDCEKPLRYLINQWYKYGKKRHSIYQVVLQYLYDRKSLYYLLENLLSLYLTDEYKNLFVISQVYKIAVKQGDVSVNLNNKQIYFVKNRGLELQQIYRKTGTENKLPSLTYQMLNALKVKNTQKFMEIVFQAYSYHNKPVPSIFVDLLMDNRTLLRIGYAFLIGLSGENKEKGEEAHADN